MHQEIFGQWFKSNKTFINPFENLGKAATEVCKKTTEQNLEIIEKNIFRLSDQMKRLSTIKKPEDILLLGKNCIHENLSAMVEDFQKLIKINTENLDKLAHCFGNVPEPFVKAAKKTTSKITRNATRKTKKARRK